LFVRAIKKTLKLGGVYGCHNLGMPKEIVGLGGFLRDWKSKCGGGVGGKR
jgi:hypothetical protein